jgi:hypothetical protein
MKRNYSWIWVVCLVACFALARCSKGYTTINTTYTVYLSLQSKRAPDADTIYTENWKAYYHYGDTSQYRLHSYDDAEKGRLISIKDAVAVQGTAAGALDNIGVQFRNLTQKSVILWIVQPDSMMYAWRQVELVDGLDEMSTRLVFRTWEPGDYELNRWKISRK